MMTPQERKSRNENFASISDDSSQVVDAADSECVSALYSIKLTIISRWDISWETIEFPQRKRLLTSLLPVHQAGMSVLPAKMRRKLWIQLEWMSKGQRAECNQCTIMFEENAPRSNVAIVIIDKLPRNLCTRAPQRNHALGKKTRDEQHKNSHSSYQISALNTRSADPHHLKMIFFFWFILLYSVCLENAWIDVFGWVRTSSFQNWFHSTIRSFVTIYSWHEIRVISSISFNNDKTRIHRFTENAKLISVIILNERDHSHSRAIDMQQIGGRKSCSTLSSIVADCEHRGSWFIQCWPNRSANCRQTSAKGWPMLSIFHLWFRFFFICISERP